MYKLVALFAFIAVCAAAPKPQLLTYGAPAVVSSVVSPAVTSYSSYSTSIVHGSPVVSVPVVRTAPVVHAAPVVRTAPLYHTVPVVHAAAPVVHAVPLTYSAPVYV